MDIIEFASPKDSVLLSGTSIGVGAIGCGRSIVEPIGALLDCTSFILGTAGSVVEAVDSVESSKSDGIDKAEDTLMEEEIIPDIRGLYRGSFTETDIGCTNPLNNGTFNGTATLNISSQESNGPVFSGSFSTEDITGNFNGMVTINGQLSGTFNLTHLSGIKSEGTFSVTLAGNSLEITYSGKVIVRETCSFTGTFSGIRTT